ncbi:MAG: 16S rRNA (guanine(527)-N(7))-methyltransferase RsmG [Pseudomonadota bacterium]
MSRASSDLDLPIDVSRETTDHLKYYTTVLLKWNRRINLISRGSEKEVWKRHVLDSLQLWSFRPANALRWVDLGSGAGFPGLVVAIVARAQAPDLTITLVESDARKCAFLNTVLADLSLNATVINERIEDVERLQADVISARALAPLEDLLGFAEKHRRTGGICLFPKGETVHKELEAARKLWTFDCQVHRSRTNAASAILEIGAFERD